MVETERTNKNVAGRKEGGAAEGVTVIKLEGGGGGGGAVVLEGGG